MQVNKKKKVTIRNWMFVDNELLRDGGLFSIYRTDYKEARRILRRAHNKQQTDRFFRGLMTIMGIPMDQFGCPKLKGLPIADLVMLEKVGMKVGMVGAQAKARIDRIYQKGKEAHAEGRKVA